MSEAPGHRIHPEQLGTGGTFSGTKYLTDAQTFAAAVPATGSVTLAMLANMATDSIIGRATASTGVPEVLTALPFAYTGDVTRPADSNAQTIANDAVTFAKMQNATATQRLIGRNTSGSGDFEEVTFTQLLDWIGSAAQGDILYRGSSSWARLGAGTNGQMLQTQGASANPQWASLAVPYVPTNCYGVPGWLNRAMAQQTPTASTLYYFPFVVLSPITITGITIDVATGAAAGGTARVGIYRATTAEQPGALVVDGGAISTVSTGLVTATVSTPLVPGFYLGAYNGSSHTAPLLNTMSGLPITGTIHSNGTGTTQIIRDRYVAKAIAALADPGTAWDTTVLSANTASMFLRFTWT